MARTAEGAALTVAHRRAQVSIQAQALRDYMLIWPLWRGDEASFQQLLTAAVPLVHAHRQTSSALAGAYFEGFRMAERAGGSFTPRLAGPVDEDRLKGSLYVTGAEMTRKAVEAGHSPQAARQQALIRTSGGITRFVLDAGRETTVLSTGLDREANGWARATSGDPCAFCAMLASRGPVYAGEDSAEFQAHDHCSCGAEPSYEGSEWPGRGREFRELYNRAQREARESGGGSTDTANDALNNFRRLIAAG